jgi:glycosyltransferase involved in cell wall biosynthesis
MGHKIDIATKFNRKISSNLESLVTNTYDIDFQRSPINQRNIGAYQNLKDILVKNNYNFIHTHTPVASVLSRLAARNLDETKVIYTAHGFHFFEGAPLRNWLIYYPIEKTLSKFTDLLITINKEDYKLASRKFHSDKVEFVPGIGIDIAEFKNTSINISDKLNELNLDKNKRVLLSIGELNKNKNHQTVIKALKELDTKDFYYLICGRGSEKDNLIELINDLNLNENVKLLGYRNDINEILQLADIYIHPSFREGLPVSVMEAMASSLPVICSNIRGNKDLIEQNKGGYLVNPNSEIEFNKKINELLNNQHLAENMGEYNASKISDYSIDNVLQQMEKIYKEMI